MSEDFLNLEKKPGTGRDFSISVLVLVAVLIVVGGFIVFREQVEDDIAADIERQEEDAVDEETEEDGIVDDTLKEEEEDRKVSHETDIYKETAKEGDGLTHTARRAISDYIDSHELDVSKEERVYMEDYVQKEVSSEREDPFLELGETVEMSESLIDEALESASDLTPQEKENLHSYALLVQFPS